MSARRVATFAMLALAVEVLIAFTIAQGTPNPGMAAIAVVPLAAAWAFHAGRRWAPALAVLGIVTVVALRTTNTSFDLVRPEAIGPFVLTLALLATVGVGLSATYLVVRAAARPGLVHAGGLVAGAALGLGLVLVLPQADDTGDLTDEQVAALPTIDMVNFKFEPGQLRVATGQPVAFRFTNDTDDSHSFAVDALDIDVAVPSGRSRVVVVEAEPGSYAFHCSVGSHRADGMKGELVVGGGPDEECEHCEASHAQHQH